RWGRGAGRARWGCVGGRGGRVGGGFGLVWLVWLVGCGGRPPPLSRQWPPARATGCLAWGYVSIIARDDFDAEARRRRGLRTPRLCVSASKSPASSTERARRNRDAVILRCRRRAQDQRLLERRADNLQTDRQASATQPTRHRPPGITQPIDAAHQASRRETPVFVLPAETHCRVADLWCCVRRSRRE